MYPGFKRALRARAWARGPQARGLAAAGHPPPGGRNTGWASCRALRSTLGEPGPAPHAQNWPSRCAFRGPAGCV